MRPNPYALKKPCANCPFLVDKDKAISLHPERVPGIINQLLSGEASGFSCHKTCGGEYQENEEGDDVYIPGGKELQCAGSLIVLEKMGKPTQLMQIMERLGMYEPELYKPYYDMVIDYDPTGV